MRLFAIGDIHGKYNEFIKVLSYSKYDINQDVLICTGDMIDRGPDSYKLVQWFKEMNKATNGRVQAIYGNHEHAFVGYVAGKIPEEAYFKKTFGGNATVDSYERAKLSDVEFAEHLSFLGKLPLCLELGDYIFTHAGYNFSRPASKQVITTTAWTYGEEDTLYKLDLSSNEKTVVYGHTPTKYIWEHFKVYKEYGIWRGPKQIAIDCSFSQTKRIALIDLTNDIEYYYEFSRGKCYEKRQEGSS